MSFMLRFALFTKIIFVYSFYFDRPKLPYVFVTRCFRESLLYADKDIIVYDKPAGLSSVPGLYDNDSLVSRAAKTFHLPKPDKMVVHRLDFATRYIAVFYAQSKLHPISLIIYSGVMLMARNDFALRELHRQFRQKKEVRKSYCAIVAGKLDSFEGEIHLPLGRDLRRGPPFNRVDVENGKNSSTYWNIVFQSMDKSKSFLNLVPMTGRTHQLRIHMASIGNPILGDKFYGSALDIASSPNRLLLHAEKLRIIHPSTGKYIEFQAICPFLNVMMKK